jgi:hypothetical protein
MLNRTAAQTGPRHGNPHLEGRHSAHRGGVPVAAHVPVPPQYHGGRHRAGIFARLTRTAQ